MKKLRGMYRYCDKLLKIYEVSNKSGEYYYGMLYEFVYNKDTRKYDLVLLSKAKFYDKDMADYRVKEYFGMFNARLTTCDKIVDVNHRVIWTNDDYDEWEHYAKKYNEYEEDKINEDTYADECETNLWDERENLNVKVDGCIVTTLIGIAIDTMLDVLPHITMVQIILFIELQRAMMRLKDLLIRLLMMV